MNKQLDVLMQKEMTRKEFLTTMGFGVASVLGFSGIIKFLTGDASHHSNQKSGYGYGTSTYGR